MERGVWVCPGEEGQPHCCCELFIVLYVHIIIPTVCLSCSWRYFVASFAADIFCCIFFFAKIHTYVPQKVNVHC